MIPELRNEFNAKFSEASYARQRSDLAERTGCEIPFRISETPLFIPNDFALKAARAAEEILFAAASPEMQAIGKHAVPKDYDVPAETARPLFSAVDFAITGSREDPGLKLIELQGFPSLYHFQPVFSSSMRECYGLPSELSGLIDPTVGYERYYNELRDAILGGHDPREVVLLEIDPYHQKTYVDFALAKKQLGIALVDISEVTTKDNKLFYRDESGSLQRIHRIYNRSIHDEIVRKGIKPGFDVSKSYDVEWAGHPNWYFKISKILLPYLTGVSDAVPQAVFLSEANPEALDLESFVLKPLYSFAGAGVIVSPTMADIASVPSDRRSNWILQEKVEYGEIIHSPFDFKVKAELRIMLLWPDSAARPQAMHTLVRLARGKMMGVDFNRGLEWVGSSCGLVA